MTLEKLQKAKLEAMKAKDVAKKDAINNMIDAVQKAAITPKGRVEITEDLVDEVLIKHQKVIEDMVNSCPKERTDLLEKYQYELALVECFAPQLICNGAELFDLIKDIVNGEIAFAPENKGKIMKMVSPVLKNKADMRAVSNTVTTMCNERVSS